MPGYEEEGAVIDVHVVRHDELERISRALRHRSSLQHGERVARQDRGAFTYLVAWDRDEPVGHVGIDWPNDREPELGLEFGPHAMVHDLEVLPRRRNEGIGRALMVELEDQVRERGLPAIMLTTGIDDGYAAARHLYRSLGYVEIPGTLHVESSRLPPDRAEVFLEILTIWTKTV